MPWYNCFVLKAGPSADRTETESPVIQIMLTDQAGAFANCWFFAANSAKSEMLTAALSAMTTNATVSVQADVPNVNNNPLTQISSLQVLASTASTASAPAVARRVSVQGLIPTGPPDLTVHNLTVTGDIFLTATPAPAWPFPVEANPG